MIATDRKHNSNLVAYARDLRKNMTKEGRRLWYDFLNTYPIKFTRQKILGKYIADFYCAKANLVIELDGSQHYEPEGIENDNKRTAYLNRYKIRLIRISNLDIKNNFEAVCQYIDEIIKASPV